MSKEDREFEDIGEFVEKFYKMAKNMTVLRTEMVRISNKMNDLPISISKEVNEKEESFQLLFDEAVKRMDNNEDFILVSIEGIKQEQNDLKQLLHDLQGQLSQQENHVKVLIDETKSNKQQTVSSNKQEVKELTEAVMQLQNHLKNLTDHLNEREEKDIDERENAHVYLKDLKELVLSQQKDIDETKSYIKADQISIKDLIDNQLRGLEREIQDTNRLILSIHAQMVNTSQELETKFEKSPEWEPIEDSIDRLENMYLSLYEQQMAIHLIKDHDKTEDILRKISQKVNKGMEELNTFLQGFQFVRGTTTIKSDVQRSRLNKEGDLQALESESVQQETPIQTSEPIRLQSEEVQTSELENRQQEERQTSERDTMQQEETPEPEKSRVFDPFKGILTGQHPIKDRSFSQSNVSKKEVPIQNPFANGIHFRSLQEVDLKKIRPVNPYMFNQLSRPFTTHIHQGGINHKNEVKKELFLEGNSTNELNEDPGKELNETPDKPLHGSSEKDFNNASENEHNEKLLGVTSFVSNGVTVSPQKELDNLSQSDWLFEEKNKGIKDYFASMFSFLNKEKK